MIVVSLTDLHGRTGALPAIADDLARADLVLLTGDLTHFGGREDAARVLDAVRACNRAVLAVAGNCDRPEVAAYLAEEGISLDCRHVVRNGVAFLGVGASLPCPGRTPSEITEADFETFLTAADSTLDRTTPAVLVVHQPPHGTAVDRAYVGGHVGSRSVRLFIEVREPLACFCGHIHEGRGIDAIGRTTVINPGPLSRGGYAWAEIADGTATVEIRQART